MRNSNRSRLPSRLIPMALCGLVSSCSCEPRLTPSRGRVVADPLVVDFGQVATNSVAFRTLTVSNVGEAAVDVTRIEVTGDQRLALGVDSNPLHLAAGEQRALSIRYRAPATPGIDHGTLTFSLEQADVPELTVLLLGEAVQRPEADGGSDAGAPDAGVIDAGVPDAGVPDAGVADAGVPDSGSGDAGTRCADGGIGCQPVSVHAYNGFSCATVRDGRVLCWGMRPESCCTQPYWDSQLVTNLALPFVPTGSLALEGGDATLCIRQGSGPVACIGRQARPSFLMTSIPGWGTGVRSVAAYSEYVCGVMLDAGIECFGGGVRINDGVAPDAVPFPDVTVPTEVTNFGPADEVTVGATHICTRGGSTVKCWGYNGTSSGCPMGNSPGVRLPGIVQPMSVFDAGVKQIVAHDRGTCVVDGNGDVLCWGTSLGPWPGAQTYSGCAAVKLTGFDAPVTSMCSGGQHACALQGNGRVRCWGESYQLGILGPVPDGGLQDPGDTSPRLIPGVTDVVQLSCGTTHHCALTANREIWCWGDNHAYGTTLGAIGIFDAGVPFSALPVRVQLE